MGINVVLPHFYVGINVALPHFYGGFNLWGFMRTLEPTPSLTLLGFNSFS